MRYRLRCAQGEAILSVEVSLAVDQLNTLVPFQSAAKRWGALIHFPCMLALSLDSNPVTQPVYGAVCYWVQGRSLVIPFGLTPLSIGNESRLVTAMNHIGEVVDGLPVLNTIQEGDLICFEQTE